MYKKKFHRSGGVFVRACANVTFVEDRLFEMFLRQAEQSDHVKRDEIDELLRRFERTRQILAGAEDRVPVG